MPDTPLDQRKFTDREVREILKKAVEETREAAPSSQALVSSDGLSLAELKGIGVEVGIDGARIESAARAVALGDAQRSKGIFGGPVVLDVERTVAGAVDTERTHEVLSLIRRVMGDRGEVDEVGGALEWSSVGESGSRYVTLAERDGKTTIRGSANLKNAVALTYLGPGMIGVILSIIGLARFAKTGSEIGLVLALALIPILFPVLRSVVNRISARESAKLQTVVEELARLTEGPDPSTEA